MRILGIYNKLKNEDNILENGFISYPLDSTFRLAIDENFNPTVLISQKNFDNSGRITTNFKLDKLEVKYNVHCKVRDIETKTEASEAFTIVRQINGNSRMHEYFLRVIDGIITELGKSPSALKLNSEIEYLVKLFSSPKKVDERTVLGLWGELVYIISSKEIELSIEAWHLDRDNLFDFSFVENNVEVKTTTRNSRIHEFNNSQLRKFRTLQVNVASMMTEKAALGSSIMDLWISISNKCTDQESLNKLTRIVGETITQDIEALNNLKYNYNMAQSTLKVYDSQDLPNILLKDIPQGIMEVHVSLNLDMIK